jgi:hypothetical protein
MARRQAGNLEKPADKADLEGIDVPCPESRLKECP